MHAQTHTHMQTHTETHTHTHTCRHTQKRTHTQAHTRTHWHAPSTPLAERSSAVRSPDGMITLSDAGLRRSSPFIARSRVVNEVTEDAAFPASRMAAAVG